MIKKDKTHFQTGIYANDEKDIKRAFNFENAKVENVVTEKKKLIVKPGYFKVSGDGIFYTIQGEGISMGRPAVFLRLHFCNLRCHWCDTWYTWNSNTKEFWTESKDWSIEETEKLIRKNWKVKNSKLQKRLIITGGEPLLQKDTITQLISRLPDWYIEIETNGTILPTGLMLERCQFNCSPKLRNSRNAEILRIKPDVLKTLNQANTMFKFVAMTDDDIDEIENDFIKPYGLDVDKIIIMPQGVTAQEISENAKNIVETVKKKGYRLLGRLHCDIWGVRRRV